MKNIMVLFTSPYSYCINNANAKEFILYLSGYPINNNPTKEHFFLWYYLAYNHSRQ